MCQCREPRKDEVRDEPGGVGPSGEAAGRGEPELQARRDTGAARSGAHRALDDRLKLEGTDRQEVGLSSWLLGILSPGYSHIPPTRGHRVPSVFRPLPCGRARLNSDCTSTRARSHCESGPGFVSAAARSPAGSSRWFLFGAPRVLLAGAAVARRRRSERELPLGPCISPGVTEVRPVLNALWRPWPVTHPSLPCLFGLWLWPPVSGIADLCARSEAFGRGKRFDRTP